jgi:hypothetical protein
MSCISQGWLTRAEWLFRSPITIWMYKYFSFRIVWVGSHHAPRTAHHPRTPSHPCPSLLPTPYPTPPCSPAVSSHSLQPPAASAQP